MMQYPFLSMLTILVLRGVFSILENLMHYFRTVLGSLYIILDIVCVFVIYVMEVLLKISTAEGPPS